MRLRMGKVTVAVDLAAQPVTTNLLKLKRASIKMIGVSNLQIFISSMTFFFSSRRRHTRSVSAFLLNRSSDLKHITLNAASGGIQGDVLATDNNTVGMGDAGIKSARSEERRVGKECRCRGSQYN